MSEVHPKPRPLQRRPNTEAARALMARRRPTSEAIDATTPRDEAPCSPAETVAAPGAPDWGEDVVAEDPEADRVAEENILRRLADLESDL